MDYSDDFLKGILTSVKHIACVGVSANPVRPSYFVARYLGLKGFRVTPVNPGLAGQTLFGATVYASLSDLPDKERIEMVDIFRNSEAAGAIVREALEVLPNLKVIWMQIGVTNPEAAALAEARGIKVVQDHCPKIEHQRLFGELRKGGFNTGIISSKL